VDALDPSVTREEIRNVKAEIQEEQKISDLEVLMEEQQEEQKEMNLEQKAMHQYFYDYREHFVELADVLESQQENDGDAEKVMDVIAPSGIAVVFVRIRGIGKLMLSFRGENENIIIQNVRTMEKRELSWTGFLYTIKSLYEKEDLSDPKAAWERIYGEPYAEEKEPIPEKTEPVKAAKKEKIAPAQKSAPHKVNTESNTDHREAEKPVQTEGEKALEEAPIEPEQTEPVEQGQIEGQDNIMNHPEYLPEGMARTEASVDGQPVPAEVEPTAGQRKEECLAEISMIQGNIEIGKYGAALQVAKKLVENLEILA
jgi:hypothetical protein